MGIWEGSLGCEFLRGSMCAEGMGCGRRWVRRVLRGTIKMKLTICALFVNLASIIRRVFFKKKRRNILKIESSLAVFLCIHIGKHIR